MADPIGYEDRNRCRWFASPNAPTAGHPAWVATGLYDGRVGSNRDLIEELAEALDRDDYTTVRQRLADDVEYVVGDQRHNGPDAVVNSYRTGSETARELFDHVVYKHAVFPTDQPNTFRVEFTDDLTIGDGTLRHQVEQHMTVSPGNGVVRIVDIEIPGERERVDEFLSLHGLTRDR